MGFSDDSNKPVSHEEEKLTQWTNLPFTSGAVDALKMKLLAWSVLVIVLFDSNVSITTLFFIRFKEALTKETAVFYLGPLVLYYFVYWVVRHVEYFNQRDGLKPFLIIEQLKPAIEDITNINKRGQSQTHLYQPIKKFTARYNEVESSVPKIVVTRYVVYAIFDVLIPLIIGVWALSLYLTSLLY
ncbi:hypothetical protein [Idiomarina aminovorans]|uniref:hypothetical protein n=1 Tax=Idiomarina aminovorans TaxID=2914829 RepID=UPI0020037E1D|nr:hypothetical protein [Idiomarina sp. ATCH4]MCK7458491.1 hypothetical protein [Idiomarina sp. ATCH4]